MMLEPWEIALSAIAGAIAFALVCGGIFLVRMSKNIGGLFK